MNNLWNKYVIRPLHLILTNGSILVLILIILLLDRLVNDSGGVGKLESIDQLLNGKWAYEQLPLAVMGLGGTKSIFASLLTIFAFFFQSFITVVTMLDLKLIYQNSRKGIIHTFGKILVKDVLWYFLWITLIYLIFGGIALVFYLPSLWLWKTHNINTIIPLSLLAIFLFPGFYSMLSIGGKISVIEMTWREKFNKVIQALRFSSLIKIYAFYPIRLGIEFVSVILAPALALWLFNNRLIAFIAGVIALLIPLAAFRASTYEFFLDLYKHDPLISKMFEEHFNVTRKN